MKVCITSFNQKLGVNPIVGRMLDAIPGLTRVPIEECEVLFLLFIAPECDFVLDADLLERAKKRNVPVIVFDYTETFPGQFILGADGIPSGSAYLPVANFLLGPNVKAYFKRELLTGHTLPQTSYPVFPVDWTLADQPQPHIDTPEEYANRPIDVFMSWGYSNESRPKLMGELLRQAGRFGAHFVLTEDDLQGALKEGQKRIFALLFTPHYRRIHINQIYAWQEYAKVSISMFGAGKKCFRCAEASYNCVMAQEAPHLIEWSYPWESATPEVPFEKSNCIGLVGCDETESVRRLYELLRIHQGSLSQVYLNGMENNRRYHNTAYARDYLLPRIQEALK